VPVRNLLLLILLVSASNAMAAFNIKQVAQGIYVHQGLIELPNAHNHDEIANIGFIVGKRCIAVIDSGGNPRQGLLLKEAIHKVSSLPICYVINTHVHPDHIFGNSAFKGIPNINFVGHKKLSRAMATRAPFYLARSKEQIGIKLTKHDVIPPNMTVKDTLDIDLGERILTLNAYPTAHTDNDISVFDKQTNTMWLSDLLFVEHLPVLDGSLNGWLKVLGELEKRSFDVVIPGHGSVDRDWPESLQAQKKYLQTIVNGVRSEIKLGHFLEDVLTTLDYKDKAQWQLFNDFHKKNLSSAFSELEWED